ncbi:mannitol dehydrogenase family protein [Butyricicoccus faecihominis]|uniref:mannitol dehydrogenase family protein n=1 Tax=Butyricicoccaceae TaxID=3085642 RepID=UPI0024790BE1|nr:MULTISPECIES: mannitol dehydrogenase family protein [Butyricicoccaceae]MCQ5128129.1 mannitol dehydrogenase family protein [Butyricicoccus faecihominis]WNX86432.1 mannitol dehydrogenase family protein [Agathobaculum sp. NTUH-O15-33]
MKLTRESIKHHASWRGFRLPQYDIDETRRLTQEAPAWLHFGAGNLFRAFPAVLAQRLLTAGLSKTGVICCDGYDEDLIDRCYRDRDHLSLVVTVYSNGTLNKEVVGSVTESLKLSEDGARLQEIFLAPSLQMVSFTLTEKGYVIQTPEREFLPAYEHDRVNGPDEAACFFGKLSALCLARCRAGLPPLALVSLDNFQNNGERLERAVRLMVEAWLENGLITEEECDYLLRQCTYPVSMIDKITPHPDERIAKMLEKQGIEGMLPFVTAKNTYAAGFVNTESLQYLLIEDAFPNGHPALEQCGVILTRRDIVERSAHMKVSTCMNPMDTALGVFGCLLGYNKISDEMKDQELVTLVTRMSELEAMPMVADPGVIDPVEFLHRILGERYPNPFLQDTPQRIMTDTSRKLSLRFGETLYAYYNSTSPMHKATKLIYIPLVLAGWLRYLVGVDDRGEAIELSSDPNLDTVRAMMGAVKLGDQVPEKQLYKLLSSRMYFGVNLFEVGVGEIVVQLFNEMNRGPRAIRETLNKYCGEGSEK